MSRIFISGSSTGLGLMAADLLIEEGHQVVLHARNAARADDARRGPRRTRHRGVCSRHRPQARDVALQDRLIEICAELSDVALPD
jgi:NAD(P)-dependent dehydrogenase (short-subunit alcohol dehydrogenase family)